jgi:hypothetical protein
MSGPGNERGLGVCFLRGGRASAGLVKSYLRKALQGAQGVVVCRAGQQRWVELVSGIWIRPTCVVSQSVHR